jgi:dinuclear metal center YbgI/SA1388 family protein
MTTVKDIYITLDKIAPFSLVHGGDNSGLLVGSLGGTVNKVLLTLDITNEAVREAAAGGAEVIVSHHPVIYDPLSVISEENPAALAFRLNIACICSHSPLDLAAGGINDIIYGLLKEPFGLSEPSAFIEEIHENRGYGLICESSAGLSSEEAARSLKSVFGCRTVRYVKSQRPIKKLAFCSGGAGGNTSRIISMGLDAYITGDIKYDQFIAAKNAGISLFDCGHFYTEVIVLEYLKKRFSDELPGISVKIAESARDPVEYVF